MIILIVCFRLSRAAQKIVTGRSLPIPCPTCLSDQSVILVRSVVEWLKRRAYDQHGRGSKLTHAIPLCLWERHFTELSPA